MELFLMALIMVGGLALWSLVIPKPKNVCSAGGCYMLGVHEYEKQVYCYGHYIMRKHDPYFEYRSR